MKLPTILSLSLIAGAAALQAGETTTTSYDKGYRAPAVEAMGGPYWSIYGGVDIDQTADASDDRGDFGGSATDIEGDTGWFAGLKFGYDFDSDSWAHAAIELEAQYTRVDADFSLSGGGFSADSSGDIHAAHLMINGLVKFKPVWHLRPYIGGGVGVAHLWLRDASTEVRFGGVPIGRDVHEDAEDWTFAYQGIGGLDWYVNDRFTIYTEYKALVFHDAVGLENYLHHQVGLGVRFKF
jgi:opacity protein-like surface antigen